MIDGHGDDLWKYGGKVRHNFSSNIFASFNHDALKDTLWKSPDILISYPEPEPFTVEQMIAELNDCASENVVVTNGATEVIYLIAKQYSVCKSAILKPTFREYQDACRMHGHSVTFFTEALEIPSDCDLVWYCNPNNPTGKMIASDAMLSRISSFPDKILIIDQAYADYANMPPLSAKSAINAGNVILLGSLTKRFAIPGLRIGYAIGCRNLMQNIRQWRMPWSVNGPAIAAAKYLLDNIENYPIDVATLHSEAMRMSESLRDMNIEVLPTSCNFILCKLPKGAASDLKKYLLDEAGILIRDASNFEGLNEAYFRVAAQSREENDLLIKMIAKWLDC